MTNELMKMVCLMSFLNSLPFRGIDLTQFTSIAFQAQGVIESEIEKYGMTDEDEVVKQVHRRLEVEIERFLAWASFLQAQDEVQLGNVAEKEVINA